MPLPIPLDKAENREEVAAYEEREQKRQRTELEKVSSFVQRCLSSKSHQPGRVCYLPLSSQGTNENDSEPVRPRVRFESAHNARSSSIIQIATLAD